MRKIVSWPVAIAGIYILFMLILIGFVFYSQNQSVHLVTDDYYEQELKYQQQIDRMNRAGLLSSPVSWKYDQVQKNVTVQFPAETNHLTVRGHILFFRPSDAAQDKVIALRLSPENSQQISTDHLRPGYWKLKIFWQQDQKEYYAEGQITIK
jgi:hypothetical protein